MTAFLETHPLTLTPITPIHVGCGEDFEPTNYVIADGVLHHFDPSQVRFSTEDLKQLRQAVNKQGDDSLQAVQAVQAFFHQRKGVCIEASRLKVPVAAGVAEWYASRVGQVAQRERGGRAVGNQLEIERTAHHPHNGRPYLPGSSLKGSMRTAWLNAIDPSPVIQRDPNVETRERGSDLESELLGYAGRPDGSRRVDLHRDPFRLVKLADASSDGVASRVVFSVDRDKEQRLGRNGLPVEKNLFVGREVIAAAQHRALAGEIRFDRLPNVTDFDKTPARDKRIGGFADLARACNRFYGQRWQESLTLIRRRFPNDVWVDGVTQLFDALRPDLDEGRVMLLRVGRHSGAESVTLEKRRAIRIMRGPGRPAQWRREATTIWLAAEREDSRAELLPFGFLLIERVDTPASDALARWCEREMTRASATENAVRRTAKPGSGTPPPAAEEVWEKARVRFNRANGTLTVVRSGGMEATALAPQGEELLRTLPENVQRKVRSHEFVRVTARVRNRTLISIEAMS